MKAYLYGYIKVRMIIFNTRSYETKQPFNLQSYKDFMSGY